MSEKNGPPTPEEALEAMRASAELTGEAVRDGGLIDLPALEAQAARLDEINSRFPATREFLRSRGVAKVSQLDAEGRAALKTHLEKTLAEALAK